MQNFVELKYLVDDIVHFRKLSMFVNAFLPFLGQGTQT